jgi:hypothetical protein
VTAKLPVIAFLRMNSLYNLHMVRYDPTDDRAFRPAV